MDGAECSGSASPKAVRRCRFALGRALRIPQWQTESARVQPFKCPQQGRLTTRNLPPHPFRTVYGEGHFVAAPPPQRGKPRKNISEGPALQMLAASNARNEESPASPFPNRLRGRPVRSGSAPATRKVPQEYLRGSSPPNARSK
jgi:hypothetical protein